MKVIKANTGDDWTKQITCTECQSVLEIVPKDIRVGGSSGYVTCPVCCYENIFDLDELPPAIKSKKIKAYNSNSSIDPY